MTDIITPSAQQFGGLTAIADWYKNGTSPYFYLGGYAGSGKTAVAPLAVEMCGLDPEGSKVLYASFTGKAAMIMRRKGMRGASTIHQLIYVLRTKENGELVFGRDPDSPLRSAKLLVLDECSMVNDEVAEDLLSFGTKILVLGDPGQLPPVKGSGYFTSNKPNYFLTEIHRQALENPIIRLSKDVREGKNIPFGDHGKVRKLSLDDFPEHEMLEADQIITGMHKTRHAMNQYMMELDGYPDSDFPYMAGIKVMCLRNYHDDGLFNGLIGRTTEFVDPSNINDVGRFFVQRVNVEESDADTMWETQPMRMHMGSFEDNWTTRSPDRIRIDDDIVESARNSADKEVRQYLWDFGYAITVHKAQGSQWDNVILVDDNHLNWKPRERAKWLYTAMTRATENFTILV